MAAAPHGFPRHGPQARRAGWLAGLPPEQLTSTSCPDDAIALTQALAQELHGTCVVLDAERSIARLVLGGWTVDIARQDGAHIEEDLWRRDYRINAIAVSVQPWGELWDPTGGLHDLQQGFLTAVSETNLTDDPLRLLRGLRLAAEIPLTISSQTMGWIERHAALLPEAAPERILSELQRLVRANTLMQRSQPCRACRCWPPGVPKGDLQRPKTEKD